jgi:hypothetical protein
VSKQNKVACLTLDLPGAPEGWHTVDGLKGLVHPSIPVPHRNAAGFVEAHKQRVPQLRKEHDQLEERMEQMGWRRNWKREFIEPPCPVKVVHLTEKQALDGQAKHAAAVKDAGPQIRQALRAADNVEATLAHNEAVALSGEEE